MQPEITRDDFASWRENPVTQWVFAGLAEIADLQRQHWIETSWGQGACLPNLLAELRVRADTAKSIIEVEYERLCAVLEQEPKG
jgi:hypothetical protein